MQRKQEGNPLYSEHEAQTDEAEKRRAQEVDDFRGLMADPRGRRVMWRILDRAGVHRTSFNHSGSVMAFNEGRRDIGLFLTDEILALCPDAYLTMLKEHAHDD